MVYPFMTKTLFTSSAFNKCIGKVSYFKYEYSKDVHP